MNFYLEQLILASLLIVICQTSSALQWVRFHVPEWVKVEEPTMLTCQFDLQRDALYSVKWYKDGREIYRYVPAITPPQEAFELSGVMIDVKKSDDQHLVLDRVNFNTSGRYKCEILADSPFFFTLVKSDQLNVVDLPEVGPVLGGAMDEYRLGELINITCSTSPSVPPAALTWYINGREATREEIAPAYYYQASPLAVQEPVSSSLRLLMKAHRRYFHRGVLELQCRATIGGLQDFKVDHTAKESTSLRHSMLEGANKGTETSLAGHLFVLTFLVSVVTLFMPKKKLLIVDI